jgi:hypothetical protein
MQVESSLLVETPEAMAIRIFQQMKPHTAVPEVRVQFRPFTNLSSRIRLREGRLIFGISDLLRAAPEPILESLIWILLSKLYRRSIPAQFQKTYREYVNRAELREDLSNVRQSRGRKKADAPAGIHFDLAEVFDTINREYFANQLARPLLGWSPQRARTVLGQYDPHHHSITLSRVLDHARVPRLVIDFVMYHEMLHIQIPVTHGASRRTVHPPEFRAAEKRFVAYAEAKAFLKRLNGIVR